MSENIFVNENINDYITQPNFYKDSSGALNSVDLSLQSFNFNGSIPTITASVGISQIPVGSYIVDDDNNIYPIVSIDFDSPDIDESYYLNYLKDNEIITLIYSSSAASVSIIYEDWENKVLGTNGWTITKEGNAIFSNVAVRGDLEATTLDVGGANGIVYDGTTVTIGTAVTILGTTTTDSLQVGTSPNILKISASPNGVYGEDGIFITSANYWYSTGKFSLGGPQGITFNSGSLVIGTDVYINAGVTVNALSVGTAPNILKISSSAGGAGNDGIYINSNNYWYSDGRFSTGGSANNAVWSGSSLTITGTINATNITSSVGTIAGFTLTNNQLSTASVIVSSSGGLRLGNPTVFSVDQFGNIIATSASITGNINATSGSFSGDITASAGRFIGEVSVSSSGAIYAGTSANSGQRTVLNASGLYGYHSNGLEAFALPISGSPRIGTFTIIPTGIVSQSASNANMVYGNVDGSGAVTDGIVIRGFRTSGASAAIYTVQGSQNTTYTSGNGFYVDENARFKLKGATGSLAFDGNDLYISGNINARSGSFTGALTASIGKIGGFTLNNDALLATNIILSSSGGLRLGSSNEFKVTQSGFLAAVTASIVGDSIINGTNIGNGGGNIASNLRVGTNALQSNSTGINNIAIGDYSSASNTDGYNNIVLGASALLDNTTGYNNIVIGYSAGYDIRTSALDYDFYENIAIGNYALFQSRKSTFNIAIGSSAMFKTSDGVENIAIGYLSMANNTSGDDNIAIGPYSLLSNTGGIDNIGIGYGALSSNTTGDQNIAIGLQALYNAKGSNNVAIGITAHNSASAGSDNISIGRLAGSKINSSNNIALGYLSLGQGDGNGVTGGRNIAIGQYALTYMQTGTQNLAIGYLTGYQILSGSANVLIGDNASEGLTTGHNNVALGINALNSVSTNSNNVAIGRGALAAATGTGNTSLGYQAGNNQTSGNLNMYLGYIGPAVTTSSIIYLGTQDTLKLKIGSDSSASFYNNFNVANGILYVDATNNRIGINDTAPAVALDVTGNINLTGNLQVDDTVVITTTRGATLNDTLTVNTGGANITGNSTVTGTLDSTGTFVVGTRSSDVTTETEGQYLSAGNARSGIRRNTTTAGAGGDVLSIHKFNGAGTLTGTQRVVQFISDTSNAGHINIDSNLANAPAFAAPSDYRLKDDIQDFSYSTELIKNVKLRSFKWKNTGQYDVGFVAHELSEVSRDLVEGEKDGLNEEGLPEYQSVMYGRMVPYLAGAVKENILDIEKLYAKIEQLEERIKELENKNNV